MIQRPIPPGIPKDPGKILGIFKRIIQAGKKFFDVLINGDDIKNKKPVNPQKDTADDIMQLNAVLQEYRRNVSAESKELENGIKEVCREVFNQIIESVEFANSEFNFYKTSTLQRKLDEYLSEIDGIFEMNVIKRISLDDTECEKILKMLPGDLKGTRMAELKKKVFKESIEDLCKKLDNFQMDISESMEMAVSYRLDSLENSLEEKKAAFEKMTEDTENTKSEKEKICLYSVFKMSMAALCGQIVEEV